MTIKSFEEWMKDVIGIPEDFKDEYEPVELENLTELEELYQQYLDGESNFKPVHYIPTLRNIDWDGFHAALKNQRDDTRIIRYTVVFDNNRLVHRLGIKPIHGEFQFFNLGDEEARDICVSTAITLDEWKITWANFRLEEIGEEPMTQDEVENLHNFSFYFQEPETTELQRLAGFESI